jgi:LysR family glycine cleavage system transcriptional activator
MQVKRSRLPLTALRCFEAAGRYESFSQAADELAVSQAAVSRQVWDLERMLGRRLFERSHRQVRLNNHGARLLGQLTSSFDAIEALLAEMALEGRLERITVSVEPSFASLWLVPRLGAFAAFRPGVEVQIDATAALAQLRASGCTLAIRHSASRSSWPGTQERHLCDVELTPMLSRSLTGSQGIKEPADLQGVTLLCDESRAGWSAWLEAAGVQALVPVRGPPSRTRPSPRRARSSGRVSCWAAEGWPSPGWPMGGSARRSSLRSPTARTGCWLQTSTGVARRSRPSANWLGKGMQGSRSD